ESDAGGELLQAGGAAGEHEDGDVAAADEQEEADGDKEQDQSAFELAEQPVIEGLDLDAIAVRRKQPGVFVSALLDDAGELACYRICGDAGTNADGRLAATVGIEVWRHGEIDLGVMPGEARPHDADDGVLLLVEQENLAE